MGTYGVDEYGLGTYGAGPTGLISQYRAVVDSLSPLRVWELQGDATVAGTGFTGLVRLPDATNDFGSGGRRTLLNADPIPVPA